MINDIFLATNGKMQKSIEALKRELDTIRTGRATPALVDHIKVDVYGAPTPLNQLATISIPEARLLLIQPWDRNIITNITKAILKSELGLNPVNDGATIRLTIPPPTEERRKELIKVVHSRVEEAKVSIRNVRRDTVEELRKLKKNKEISQDEEKRALDRLQKLTEKFAEEATRVGQDKEAEISEI
jgi:ribosome recycling factor